MDKITRTKRIRDKLSLCRKAVEACHSHWHRRTWQQPPPSHAALPSPKTISSRVLVENVATANGTRKHKHRSYRSTFQDRLVLLCGTGSQQPQNGWQQHPPLALVPAVNPTNAWQRQHHPLTLGPPVNPTNSWQRQQHPLTLGPPVIPNRAEFSRVSRSTFMTQILRTTSTSPSGTSTALMPCMLPLHAPLACSPYMLALHAPVACSPCMLPLHAPVACSPCMLPLHAETNGLSRVSEVAHVRFVNPPRRKKKRIRQNCAKVNLNAKAEGSAVPIRDPNQRTTTHPQKKQHVLP